MIKRLFALRPTCTGTLLDFLQLHFAETFRLCTKSVLPFFFLAITWLPEVSRLSAQDTTPPVLISPARDTSFACGQNPDLINSLTQWYNAAGNAVAQDDSGAFIWEANISLGEAVSRFVSSRDTLCGNTQNVVVTFTAVDAAGNRSQTTTARFFTFDQTRPTLTIPPNVTVFCSPQIRDTLIRWIRNKGGYIAMDECTNILTWTRFQYSISQGNTIIQTGGGSINNGPYPTIPNGICHWRLNINFWVEDECGNETVTFGTTSFSVIDNAAPVPVNLPADVTVTCDAVPSPPTVAFVDGCTVNPTINFSQISTQDADTLLCGHYSYTLTRTWVASDACNNQASYSQMITVKDTVPPVVNGMSQLDVSCSIFNPDSNYITGINDACSPVLNLTVQKDIKPVSCSYNAMYRFSYEDVCGNKDTFDQVIRVSSDSIQWVTTPTNEQYLCSEVRPFDALFSEWLEGMADSEVTVSCGDILSFVAVPGSYDISDSMTWPGTHPGSFDAQNCPSTEPGFIRSEKVDFVYYNECGQVLVASAVFGLMDTMAPMVMNCQPAIEVILPSDDCQTMVEITVPFASDDCVESNSPVVRTVSAPVRSIDPSNTDSPVFPVDMEIGPYNPAGVFPSSDASIQIMFKRMDMDDVTEFFNIYDEDNQLLGRSPNTPGECGDISMTLMLPQNRLSDWLADGYISLHFISNPVPGIPRAEINGFCGGSIQTTISFEIDVTNAVKVQYTFAGNDTLEVAQGDTLNLPFTAGNHALKFIYTDCALNEKLCQTNISVVDQSPPTITCPDNKTILLASESCSDTLQLDLSEVLALDACQGNFTYNRRVPASQEASLITFLYNESTGVHLARNKQFLFSDVFPISRSQNDVRLTLEFQGNNRDSHEYFDLLAPDGSTIGSTKTGGGSDSCGFTTTTFTVSRDIFNAWVFNNQVNFTAVPNNSGNGINPCTNLMPAQTTDGVSTLRLRLQFTDFAYTYQMSGATESGLIQVVQDTNQIFLAVNDGLTTVQINTGDGNGNTASCSFEIMVTDSTPPVARCQNAAVTIHPSGVETTALTTSLINMGSADLCSPVQLSINPSTVSCADVNTDVLTTLLVIDEQGNRDSCTALVKVKPYVLVPTFSSGLCENDTLKLFSNLPPSMTPGAYTFHWKGPNNFEFFTENPSIPNVNETYNGIYSVTVTGFNQCVTEGSVVVNIQPLTKPVLETANELVCEGEDVILTSTQFTGNITYDWYEGIAPTGVKIATTQVSNYLLKPLPGVHFYYLIASGENCTSTPSNLLKVTVIAKPTAMIEQLFYSVCEGETVTFRSTNTGNDLTYLWSGPNFNSNQKNPPPIVNAGFTNQGIYTLVVSRNNCQSDTAKANVIILERPAKPVVSSATVFCEGATFSLVVNNVINGDRYEWFQNGVLRFTTMDNTLIVPNVTPSFQGGWHVVIYKGTCSSLPSDVRSIAIDNLLEVGATNSGPICLGDSVQLMATFVPNATYRWQGPDANQQIPPIHNPKVPARPGYYSVTITTPTGCQNNTGTQVDIITPPSITALSSDVSPCMDGSKPITFSPSVFPAGGDYTYQWTSTSGFTSQDPNPKINMPTIQDTGLYSLVVYFKGCPSNTFTIPVRFNMNPPKPEIVGNNFYCSGDSIVLQSSVVLNDPLGKYIWTTPGQGEMTKTESNFFVGQANVMLQGNYTLKLEENGCMSPSSEPFNVIVKARPQLPDARSNSPVCFGSTLQLETDFAEVIYRWTGPNGFTSNVSMPSVPSANDSHEGWYFVELEKDGCTSLKKDSVFVEIYPALNVPAIIGQRHLLCQTSGSTVEICFDPNSVQPGDQMAIVNAATSDTLLKTNQTCFQLQANMSGLVPGENFLFAVVFNANCQSARSNTIIVQYDGPPQFAAGITQGETIRVCEGSLVDLEALHGPPEVDLSWVGIQPDLFFSSPTAKNTTVSGMKVGSNKVILFYSYRGCISFSNDTITILVEGSPAAFDDEFVLPYYATTELDVLANDQYDSPVSLSIANPPSAGRVEIENDKIFYFPDVTFTGNISFTYTICSSFCPSFCRTASVNIVVESEKICRVPNIISPNEDGMNDALIIPCLYNEQYPDNRLTVFNEWGNEVFSAVNYQNNWKGLYNGSPLPAGTYFYLLDLRDGNKPLQGFLIIQR